MSSWIDRTPKRRMKGQFFIIGALAICVLLYIGLGPPVTSTKTATTDIEITAENLASEFSHALNMGINNSDRIKTLRNFTLFSNNSLGGRGIGLNSIWLVFFEDGGSINVSAGNFMDSGVTFYVNVSGDYKGIDTPKDTINSSLFSLSDYKINVTIQYEDRTIKETFLANKTSIYSLISLQKEDDIIRKEILA